MKTTSAVAFLLLVFCSSACGQALEWIRQFGTSSNDISWDVSADGLGSVYISGLTAGSLEGTNAGDDDAFISKYDASGTLQWTQQFGTGADDRSRGVSADGLGNIYVSGWTLGNLEGSNAGDWDAFVSKYDAGGTLQWTQQVGTSSLDLSYDVSADGQGSVYISGSTKGDLEGVNAGNHDAFISKYDAGGILQWTRQIGTSSDDRAYSVSADGLGNVYLSGFTEGSLAAPNAGGRDVILVKFASDLPDPVADFDVDGDVDGDDVDALVGEILSGAYDFFFDLTGDEAIDNADLSQWLNDAATANGFNAPYMRGDANLDGTINAADLNALGQNWRGQSNTWQSGDFNADGIVDSRDLNEIGQNWRSTIPSAASLESVPEPAASTLLFLGILATPLLRVSGPARRPVARHRRRCVASEA
jgi:hypothetical protein